LPGESLSGQTGGTGFASAWSATIGGSGGITSNIESGLPFSTYSSASGKSVKVTTSGITSGWGDIYRPLSVTGTQEMWMTFLYKWSTPPADTNGTAMYLDFRPTSGSPPSDEPFYGVSLTNQGGLQLYGTYGASTTNLHDGNVHMIIARYWGDEFSDGKINRASLWVLTATEFDNVMNAAGGFTQANLDDNSLVSSDAKVSATSSPAAPNWNCSGARARTSSG